MNVAESAKSTVESYDGAAIFFTIHCPLDLLEHANGVGFSIRVLYNFCGI